MQQPTKNRCRHLIRVLPDQVSMILIQSPALVQTFLNRRMAVLLAGTILAAPHSSLPDALLLALAAVLWITETIDDADASTWRWPLALSLWLTPFFNPPLISPIGRITPFIIIAFIGVLMVGERHRSATPAGKPARRTPGSVFRVR
jgi:hypothetical protein